MGSWKTISKLVSSLHLILKPPLTPSHSAKELWISFVLSSLENPVKERMRVTEAERPESDVAIWEISRRVTRKKEGGVLDGICVLLLE